MTPLYTTLKNYANSGSVRFHMPGHKGKTLPIPELAPLAPLDVTEIPGTGNLYEAGEPFDTAQALWAERFGFDHCQFLTGGSTMGVHTGLALCCRPGEGVLLDRSCHRSAFHALALLGLHPVYLERPWLEEERLIGPVDPARVEELLDSHPEIKTVCITSPTYSGILSDIPAIAALVHRRGGRLMVDGAHGAHLPFLGLDPYAGADAVVMSAHKTLPAMGQTALLFTRGLDPDLVRLRASMYGSSSPSYPMMASLDGARQWMETEGTAAYRRTAERVAGLRRRFPALDRSDLDPCRLTLKVKDGPAFARALESRGIYPEMEDGGHVVLICTALDDEDSWTRLTAALEALRGEMGDCPPLPAPFLPRAVLSVREAIFAPSERRPLGECRGRVAACQIAPYPPGVPVVAPGEEIGKKELAYLRQIGYNMDTEVRVLPPSAR